MIAQTTSLYPLWQLNYNNFEVDINIPGGLFAEIAIALAVNEDIFKGMQIFSVN